MLTASKPSAGDDAPPALVHDLAIASACGIIAVAAGIWFTANGMMTFNDSAQYLSAAERIASGAGIWSASPDTGSHLDIATQIALHGRFPMSSWPPGYPMILAGVMKFGLSALQAARVVSIAGGAILASATYLGARRVIGVSRGPSAMAAILAVLGPNVGLLAFGPMAGRGFAYAESIFNPLVVATVFVGTRALQRPSFRWAAPTCLLLIAITLLRDTGPIYGVALAAGAFVGFRHTAQRARRTRVMVGVGFAAVGIATTITWSIVNSLVFASSTSVRHFGWYGAARPLASTIRVLAGWFAIPWSAPVVFHLTVVTLGIMIPLAVALRPSVRRRFWPSNPDHQVAAVTLGTSIVLSIAAVAATGMLLDRTTLPDARHLSAAQPFVYVLGAAVFKSWWERHPTFQRHPSLAGRAGPMLVVIGTLIAIPTLWILPAGRTDLHVTPLQTAALADLDRLSSNTVIVTNAPDELWLLTRRTSLVLPPYRYFTTGEQNPHFANDLGLIAELAHEKPLIVATSTSIPFPSERATNALEHEHGFELVAHCGPAVALWALPGSDIAAKAGEVCKTPGA